MPQKEIKEKIEAKKRYKVADDPDFKMNQEIKEIGEKIRNILIKVEWHALPIDFAKNKLLELFAQREEEVLERAENLIKTRLDYCQKQNGLPHCKNCGLCEEDIEAIKPHKIKNLND